MPVIRLAGKGGGFFQQAGQAAGAYEQTTADARRQQLVRDQMAQRQQAQLLQLGMQAQQQDIRNEQTNRSLDLREKAIESDRVRQQMRAATRASNGVPITGQGTIQMVTRLAQLDPQAYQQLAPQLQAMAGFDESNPATPEALDALPNLTDIYAAIAPVYAQAVKQADVQAVEKGFEETITSFIDDPKVLESDREWADWHAGVADAYARAQRSPGGATMAMMGPVYEQAKLEAARIATVKQQRERYMSRFDEYVKSNQLDEEDLQSAKLRMATMGTSQNPSQVFAEAMVRIDKDFRLAHEMGIRAGEAQGMTQAALSQVQAEEWARQKTKDFAGKFGGSLSGANNGAANQAAQMDSPPETVSSDDFPNAAAALGIDDTERKTLRDEIKASGVDLNDSDAVRQYVRQKLQTSKMMGRVYNDDASKGRFTNVQ